MRFSKCEFYEKCDFQNVFVKNEILKNLILKKKCEKSRFENLNFVEKDILKNVNFANEFLKLWLAAGEQFQYKLERPTGTQRCLLHH